MDEEGATQKFLDFARGQSLFSGKRLCVLEGAGALDSKEIKELLRQFLEPKDVAVIIADQVKPGKEMEFLTKSPAHAEEFGKLTGSELLSFVKKSANELGLKLSLSAERKLAAVYGGDSWGLITEIEKLASSGIGLAEASDVEGLGALPAVDYWPLLNSLKSRDLGARLNAIETLSERREDPAKTFNILAAMTKAQAGRFAEYDILIKSGKMDYPEAILDFAMSLGA